jgi:hypothetical protein
MIDPRLSEPIKLATTRMFLPRKSSSHAALSSSIPPNCTSNTFSAQLSGRATADEAKHEEPDVGDWTR